MFPMEFDDRFLATLPLPNSERIETVIELLQAIVNRRILPYFRTKRGTDAFRLSHVPDQLTIARMEDETNRIKTVSAVVRTDTGWSIKIHERIFDFLSFVIPTNPESRLGNGSRDEQKMLAFAEFFLRHEVEHELYPERKERDVIQADVDFAQERRRSDPTFYRMLRYALNDEMNGLRGAQYLALLDGAEAGTPLEPFLANILNTLVTALGDFPDSLILEVFPTLDTELKSRTLGEIYRKSRDPSHSLLHRTHDLRLALKLFALLLKKSEQEAADVFRAFMDRWGLVDLLRELDLPETTVDAETQEEFFQRFATALYSHLEETSGERFIRPPSAVPAEPRKPSGMPTKGLIERVEEARANPAIPRQVLEVIDKNIQNAVGHSGSKYSELIETLLAIPWGKIRTIQVSPEAFEEGLNRSHYGLQAPKEILCDFYSNLIWRCRRFSREQAASWQRTGSSFLLVGPPGVGKTSLAISIAQNLGIPHHKISLGGMRDEADMRGHSFTYEGSKPGAIVQGLIKMQTMNGMFILDEADKTEKFAIATLLEILDPEQNHLFHDKYTETSVDINLSDCHFFLTANTLDGVPPVVVNRCEVIFLSQYSVEEKVVIAREHLLKRLRSQYQITEDMIFFDPEEEADLLRYLIRTYTYEPGVRELERIIRTLFLRTQRKEIFGKGLKAVRITRERIKEYLREPTRPRQINPEDAVGEMLALGVDVERGVGSIIPIQATRMGEGATGGDSKQSSLSVIHATGNLERVMDESRKVATTGIFSCAEELGIALKTATEPIHLHFMGGSTRKDGPSAGGAIALALASLLSGRKIRRDVAMTGEIDTKGRITTVGALSLKIETAHNAGCRTVIIPRDNLYGEGGIERLPEALKEELQVLTYEEWKGVHPHFDYSRHILEVVAVDHIVQAAGVAFLDDSELAALEVGFETHARKVARMLAREPFRRDHTQRVVQVKAPEELDPGFIETALREAPSRMHLLVLPEIRDAVLAKLGGLQERLSIIDFDPKQERLINILQEIVKSSIEKSSSPVSLALIAPYFLLKRDGIHTEALPPDTCLEEISLFANNYAVQGIKIKRCKPLLNRACSIMALLRPDEIAACPFLTGQDGITVADLSFIPEKYRLDLRRAERILNRALVHWLTTLRDAATK
jgi:ATP-dependent Lon protease